jgi:hypothetical protein
MIVVVTNKQDRTADFLIIELQKRKVDYIRFNTEDYPQEVQVVWKIIGSELLGYFNFPKARVHFKDIKSIWYRRPVPAIPSPEIVDPANREFVQAESRSSLDGIWRCLNCFWVSHPDNLRKSEFKLYQLKIAKEIGFSIWPTLLTNIPTEARSFYEDQDCKVIYKPLRRGRIFRDESVSLIYSNLVDTSQAQMFHMIAYAPSLFQKYVPKLVEIRVTVIGSKVFAVEIHSQDHVTSRHDWRRGDTTQIRHSIHSLPGEVESMCTDLVNKLGLTFGAIDLILTPEHDYVFLEINPNGQWAWIQQMCPDIPLRETLAKLLIEGGTLHDD